MNRFALEGWKRLAANGKSLVYSPLSLYHALSLSAVGARGQTYQELQQVLGWGVDADVGMAKAADLLDSLRPKSSGAKQQTDAYVLKTLSLACTQRGYPIEKEYARLVKERFGALTLELDFRGAPDQTCRSVNAWASSATDGKITEIVTPASLAPDPRLLLLSAIYFQSAWLHSFPASATEDAPFHISRASRVTVPLMRLRAKLDYWEGDGYQAVDLPYQGAELTLRLLIPRELEGLAAVERQLVLAELAGKSEKAQRREVQLHLPRFRTASTLDLEPALKAMGITRACSTNADFSGLTAGEVAFIANVLHHATIAIDEEGTQASAVTAITLSKAKKSLEPDVSVTVRADRPSLYAVLHEKTRACLLLGRAADPR